MSAAVENILTQALQMPPKERAAVAARLIASLGTEMDWDVEVAWQQEVQRRIAEIDKREVVCLPWEQALQRLRENSRATA
jgi:putative addiction module component (TIGR02574 family)